MTESVPERGFVRGLGIEDVVEGGHGGGGGGEEEGGREGKERLGRGVTGERKRQELAHKLSLWVHDPH